MIYITGDTHGEISRFSPEYIPNEDKFTEDDILIVCGDFGFVFYDENQYPYEYNVDEKALDELSKKTYTILFIDGNHENFERLYHYPEIEKFGAPVHKIRNNIFHLERGRIYKIQNKAFFTFGGAYSIDRYIRQKNISYWEEEIPNDEEYKRGIQALKDVNHKVDYIVTHNAPQQVIRMMNYAPIIDDAELTGFLDWVMYETEFKKWFFGHYHEDKVLHFNDKYNFRVLFYDVEKIK